MSLFPTTTIRAGYHLLQAGLAAYTGFFSWISIRKVQTYESATKKAARYSNTVDHHLQQTQTTQAAGAVAVLGSLVGSLYCLSMTATGTVTPVVVSVVLGVGVTAAHSHVSNYWRGKVKVPAPGAGDYNDAITTSNKMRSLLGGLAASWAVVSVWYLVDWLSS